MEAPSPSRTLYVQNLPDKLAKKRLRHLLHAAFSAHGRIVWIVAEKTMKLRGQAFITFEHQTGATAAVRAMHSTDFMGRTMIVTYARQVTDRAQGAAFGGDNKESIKNRAKRRRLQRDEQQQQQQQQQQPQDGANVAGPIVYDASVGNGNVPGGEVDAGIPQIQPQLVEIVEPNKILFVQNVPKKISSDGKEIEVSEALKDLFARFSGFIEVRSVPGKDDIAFVEFSSDGEAAVAMSGLDKQSIGTPPQSLNVTFAKK